MKNIWVKDLACLAPSVHIGAWLEKPYILSQALSRVCQTLSVQVIAQQFEEALPDEYDRLNICSDLSLIRQVFLAGDDIPLTYGRVVIPASTYRHHQEKFDQLGDRPIGEKLLYHHPDVIREYFEYCHLTLSHPLYQILKLHLPRDILIEAVWGRRSLFKMKGDPLLVTELFLPSLPEYVPL